MDEEHYGTCPECGAEFVGDRLSARAHIVEHWPTELSPDPIHAESRKRRAVLEEIAKKRGE